MASIPDPDRGSQIVAVSIVMTILSAMAVTLRVWSRLISKNNRFWWDDWLAIASLVCFAGYLYHQLRSSRLTDLSKALLACRGNHDSLMGSPRAWSSYKSTRPESNCFRFQVSLRFGIPLRDWYLTTKILSSLLLYASPQNEVDALSYRCIYRIWAYHCMASLRFLVSSISMHPLTKGLASVHTRTL